MDSNCQYSFYYASKGPFVTSLPDSIPKMSAAEKRIRLSHRIKVVGFWGVGRRRLAILVRESTAVEAVDSQSGSQADCLLPGESDVQSVSRVARGRTILLPALPPPAWVTVHQQ